MVLMWNITYLNEKLNQLKSILSQDYNWMVNFVQLNIKKYSKIYKLCQDNLFQKQGFEKKWITKYGGSFIFYFNNFNYFERTM